MESGLAVVDKVGGRSTLTRCFAKYPLKLISPTKVGSCKSDVVWVYMVSFGGGMVSGDHVSCAMSVGDDCTAVLTTQASTKVGVVPAVLAFQFRFRFCSLHFINYFLGRSTIQLCNNQLNPNLASASFPN
ncbi:hypothetical protein AMTR_s00094p00068110 [Amborella trichopoda]|uniref:Uncharacterized protein n=1 Tax=Amborella trichopoda TaxID=13333 RepID=W1NTB5_AMBTC|nr:hypothetical protein AMTR_s00094p00068110 [Amborella trichopoda]